MIHQEYFGTSESLINNVLKTIQKKSTTSLRYFFYFKNYLYNVNYLPPFPLEEFPLELEPDEVFLEPEFELLLLELEPTDAFLEPEFELLLLVSFELLELELLLGAVLTLDD